MLIEAQEISVKEFFTEFILKLDVKPVKTRDVASVILSVFNNVKLPVFYCFDTGDGLCELLNNQTLVLSLRDYLQSDEFLTLDKGAKERFCSYKLYINLCKGTATEKLNLVDTICLGDEFSPVFHSASC